MTDWIFPAVYLAGFLLCWRKLSWRIAWSEKSSYHTFPDGNDWIWGVMMGLFCSIVWPLALLFVITSDALTEQGQVQQILLRIMLPRDARRTLEEVRLKERIKELERELRL